MKSDTMLGQSKWSFSNFTQIGSLEMEDNETSRDWDICRAVDLYREPRNKGDERTLSDFLAEMGLSICVDQQIRNET